MATFDAGGNLTRAQMAKVLSLAYDLEGESSAAFPDVPSSHWAHEHVQHLIGNGITEGSNGHYNPNATMTRGQFSVMMARILHDDFKVDGLTKPKPEPEPKPEPTPGPKPELAPEPVPSGLPSGATFVEYIGLEEEYVFTYKNKISSNLTITKATVNKMRSYVSFYVTRNDGTSFLVGYMNEDNSLIYRFGNPNLTDGEKYSIVEIGEQFLNPFGL